MQVWDAQEIARPITLARDQAQPATIEKANRAEVVRKREGDRERSRCNICQKRGHKWYQCRQRRKPSRGTYQSSECHRCGKKGHRAANCYAKLDPKQLQERKRQREGGATDKDRKKPKWFDEDDGQEEFAAMMNVLSTEHSMGDFRSEKLKTSREDCPSAVLDSACSTHMFRKRGLCVRGGEGEERKIEKRPKLVKTAKRGETILVREERDLGFLKNVLISGEFDENLVSIPKLDVTGHKTVFENGTGTVYDKGGKVVMKARLENGLYRFNLDQIHHAHLGSVAPAENLTLWHQRLGHRNRRQLAHAIKTDLIRGPTKELARNLKAPLCDPCVRAKSTVRPVSSAVAHHSGGSGGSKGDSLVERREKWTLPVEPTLTLIKTAQVDIKGPISVPTINGEAYFLSLIEEESKYGEVFLLKSKDEAIYSVKDYVEKLVSQRRKLLIYHADQGTELISKSLVSFLNSAAIRVTFSPAYKKSGNEIVERTHRTIFESAMSMLFASDMPDMFWGKAVLYANYIRVRLPTNTAFGYLSPFECVYGSVSDVSHIRKFGCRCYAHIHAQLREKGLNDKAYEGRLVGISTTGSGYEIWIPELQKFSESADVIFDEIVSLTATAPRVLLEVADEAKTLADFRHLIGKVYEDDENEQRYVTTRVTTFRKNIVAFRSPLLGNQRGAEETHPIHVRDVERMVERFGEKTNQLLLLDNNVMISIPAGREEAPIKPTVAGATGGREEQEGSDIPPGARRLSDQKAGDDDDNNEMSHVVSADSRRRSARAPQKRDIVNIDRLGGTLDRALIMREESFYTANVYDDHAYYIAEGDVTDAPAVEEALRDDSWLLPMCSEVFSLCVEQNTWDAEWPRSDDTVLQSRFVLQQKEDGRKKARVVAKDFKTDSDTYKEHFAPVAKMNSLRLFLTLVAMFSMWTVQIDVKTAFLNAPLPANSRIFVKPAKGLITVMSQMASVLGKHIPPQVTSMLHKLKEGASLLLKKSLYGLRDAPQLWNEFIHKYLISLKFQSLVYDPCFYFYMSGSTIVLLLLYVDDIIIASNDQHRVDYLSSELGKRFRITSKDLSKYLNIRIRHIRDKQQVLLDLSDYIVKMFARFKLLPKPSVKTPMQENLQLLREEEMSAEESAYVADFPYQEMLGAALYICVCMMPIIAYAVHVLSRFSKQPTRKACQALTRLMQFIYNVRDMPLILGGPRGLPRLVAYTDSDWAADPETRKSMIGVLIFIGWGCIEWMCTQQNHPALSSGEAEFVNITPACKLVEYYRHVFGCLGFEMKCATTIWCDNTSAVIISKNAVHPKRTRHIAAKYFKVRELQKHGVVLVAYIPTSDNRADIFTKSLGYVLFWEHGDFIMGGVLPPISDRHVPTSDLDLIY